MIPVTDPFMAGVRPNGLQKGRGGFLRSADDAPYVSDPTGDVVKSGERKGLVKRLKYGSPSNRGREIENDAGLVKYKQRLSLLGIGLEPSLATACTHLADLPVGSPEFNTAADAIVVAADRITRSSLAADRGSHGHLLLELFDKGQDARKIVPEGEAVGIACATQKQVVNCWEELLRDNGLEIIAIEASCVDDRWRLAGTLDRIVRTTRELIFVKKSGELVVISKNTWLILDLKFGKLRPAHPIQCASYDQSVPYDTETETRGEWGFELSHEHALIAHGDFGGDGVPPTIALVWVDLVAGREHGGETVVQAKAWASRDDVFSVCQLTSELASQSSAEGADPSNGASILPGIRRASGEEMSKDDRVPSALEYDVAEEFEIDDHLHPIDQTVEGTGKEGPGTADRLRPSTPSPVPTPAAGEGEVAVPRPPSPVMSPNPERLTLVQARDQLATAPDEGRDLAVGFDELWDAMRLQFDALPPHARSWRGELVSEAQRRGVPFHVQVVRTERTYHINRALIALAAAEGDDDELLRALLALVVGDVALFPSIHPGHVVGSLSATEAERLAALVDAYNDPVRRLTSYLDHDLIFRLRELSPA